MRRMHLRRMLATAIEPCPRVAPTAIMTADGLPKAPVSVASVDLARLVLAEADSARRAGRWLHGINFLNLALSLILMLEILELLSPGFFQAPKSGVALLFWFLLDFVPVTLVFAGAQRLKHLKNFGLVTAGVYGMQYLAIQRGVVAFALLAAAPRVEFRSIPVELLAPALGLALVVNMTTAMLVARLLSQAHLRRAFR